MTRASNNSGNVVRFPRNPRCEPIDHRRASPFDELTSALVLARHARGELAPAVLAALLAGVGLPVNATDGA